jgi:thioesterase domain-containing protein
MFKNLPGGDQTVYRDEIEELFGQFMNTENMSRYLDICARVGANNIVKMGEFESPVYRGDVLFFNATQDKPDGSWASTWRPHVLGTIEEHDVDGTHLDLHMPRAAGQIMEVVARKLAQ